jgi:hypothetical protein
VATNVQTRVRDALKAIVNADTTMRTLCGRSSLLMVSWRTALAGQKPVLAVMIDPNIRIGGIGDRRRVTALCAGFAEGNGAQAKAEALTQRLRELVTPPAFQAQGLDAFVAWGDAQEREIDPDDGTDTPTRVAQSQIDLPIILTAP